MASEFDQFPLASAPGGADSFDAFPLADIATASPAAVAEPVAQAAPPAEVIGPQREVLGPPMPPPPGPAGIDAFDLARRFPAGIAESAFDSAAGFMKVAGDAAAIPQRLAIDAQRVAQTGALDDAIAGMGTPEGTAAYQAYLRRRKAANEKAGNLAAQPNILSGPIETARELSERSKGDYGVDTRRDSQFFSQAASGAGSFVPALASGPLAPVTIAGMMGEGGRKDAEAHDATPEQQNQAFYSNAAVGALSEFVLGVPALLRSVRAAKMPLDTFKRMAKSVAAQVLKSSAREGAQEGLEQAAQNVIASEIAQYDKERSAMEGVGRAAAVGAFIGAPVGGITQTASNIDEKVKARSILDGTDERVNEMEAAMADEATPPDVRAAAEQAVTQMRRDAEVILGMAEPFNEQQAGQEDADNAITRNVGELWRRNYPIEEIAKELEIPVQDAGRRLSLYEEAAAKTPPPVNEEFFNEDGSPKPEFTYQSPAQADPDSRRWRTTEAGVVDVTEVDRETGIARTPDGPVRVTEEGAVPLTPVEQASQRSLGRDISPTTPAVEPEPAQPAAETSPQPPAAQPSMAPNVEVQPTPAATPAAQQPAQDRLLNQAEVFKMISESGLPKAEHRAVWEAVMEQDMDARAEGLREGGMGRIPVADVQTAINARLSGQPVAAAPQAQQTPSAPTAAPTPTAPAAETATTNNGTVTAPVQQPTAPLTFGQEVQRAVNRVPKGQRLGMRKVWIEDAWNQWKQDTGEGMSLDEFKQELLAGENLGSVELTKNDFWTTDEEAEKRTRSQMSNLGDRIHTITATEDADTFQQQAPAEQAPVPAEAAPEPSGGQDTTQPPTEPPAPPVEPATPSSGIPEGPTGIQNSVTAERREQLNLPGRTLPEPVTFQQLLDEATATIASNPTAGRSLVSELAANPRVASDSENALLTAEMVVRENRVNSAVEAMNNATPETQGAASRELQEAELELQQLIEVAEAVGTEQGRALNARKMMVNRDMSLARMRAALRAAKNGEPLTEQEGRELQELYAENQRLKQQIADIEAAQQKARDEAVMEKVAEEEALKPSAPTQEESRVIKYLDEKADEARARLREKLKKVGSAPDVTIIADAAIVGASYIAHGARSLTAFTTRLVQEFGEAIRPLASRIFDAAKVEHRKGRKEAGKLNPEQVVEKAAKEEGLTQTVVSDTIRAHLRNGLRGFDTVINAATASLKAKFPDVDASKVRRVFSDYGNVRYPSRQELEVEQRRLKTLSRLQSQLEDVQLRQAPKKTGYQRDKTDAQIRDLQKRISEEMRALGIQTTDPATQQASGLDAAKTRMRNEIEEIERALANNQRRAANQRTLEFDEEAKALQQQLTEARDRYRKAFPEDSAKKAHDKALDAAQKSLERYREMLRTGDLSSQQRQQQAFPSSNELENVQMERDAMAELVRELRLAERPKTSQEERTIKALEKSIAAMDQMLATGNLNRPSSQQVNRPETKRVAELREIRDQKAKTLAGARKAARPKTPDSVKEQRRLEQELKAMDKEIARLQQKIANNDTSSRPRKVNRPEVQIKAERRAVLDAVRDAFANLKKAQKPAKDPEVARLEANKKAIRRRIEELEERIRNNDFTPRPKREALMDTEKRDLIRKKNKVQEKFLKGVVEARLKARSIPQKLLGGVAKGLNTARAIMTSFDLSAVLRQGGFIALGNPVRAARNITPMMKAAISRDAETDLQDAIKQRPNYELYLRAKLEITDNEAASMNKAEEVFMNTWVEGIPRWVGGGLIRGSQRAYTTFLNQLRADSFDAMIEGLAKNGTPTLEEAQAVARFINIATGRGQMGKLAPAATALNTVFFAPRYVTSRFQLLLDPLTGLSISGGSARVRKAVAAEYAKYLGGVAVVMGLLSLARGDDDEEISLDPTSTDFLKPRFGNTRIDPMSGLLQATVFTAREADALGRFFTGSQEADPLYGSGGDVFWRFLRTKLSPAAGAVSDAIHRRNVVGEEMTPGKVLYRMSIPITFGELSETMQEHGMPKGTALGMLAIFGMGVQTYQPQEKKAQAPASLRRQLRKDLGIPSSRQLRKEIMGD